LQKRFLITIVSSIIIIIGMIWFANPSELGHILWRTNLYYMGLVIFLYFINMATKGFRWYLLVNSSGTQRVPLSKIFPFYMIGLALNNLTPAKLGGEPVRAYLLKKDADVTVGQGIASIFAEKLMDITVITTLAVIGAIFIIPLLTPDEAKILILVLVFVVVAIIATLIIVSNARILKKTVDGSVRLAKRVSKKDFGSKFSAALTGFTEKFSFGMGKILETKKTAAICITLTLFIWLNEAIRLYIILLALPDVADPSLAAVFIAASIGNLLGTALPGGAGNLLGIGTVFIAVGMEPGSASAASFLQVATSIWLSVPLGVMAMLVTGFKLSKVQKLSNKNNKS
jgi:uncharacterized protein (TIRG00374 family)